MLLYKNDDNEYVLYDFETKTNFGRMSEIAIAYSKYIVDSKIYLTLHKHGNPTNVKKWIDKARKKYAKAGFLPEASELFMVTGKFPLEEINHCSQTLR